jgi:hypothetical protein
MITARPRTQALLSRANKAPNQGDGYQDPSESNPTPIQNSPTLQPRGAARIRLHAPLRGGVNPTAKYPPDHQPGMRVPQGGSMCANCKYLGDDGASCTEENFVRWNGSPALPAPADEYCSDWYMPKENVSMPPRQLARPGMTGGTNPGSQPAGLNSNGPLQPGRLPLRSPGSLS